MGNPKTCCWSILTNNVVYWEDHNHVQFNSMNVMTLMVVKDRHTLVLGPKFAGIAWFGNVTNRGGGGGGGTGSFGAVARVSGAYLHARWTMIHLVMIQMMSRFSMQ